MFVKTLFKAFLLCILSFSCLMAKQYDYIIVGNGSAGAILARKLSDNFKKKVLVLEVGIDHNDDPVILDPNVFTSDDLLNKLTYDPTYSVNYPVILFNPGQALSYPEGRGWGGSSMHNYLITVRPVPSDAASWASISNNDRWSYNSLLPYMIALESYFPDGTIADPTRRGTSGPISITQSPPITSDQFAINAAAASVIGPGLVVDYNNQNDPLLGYSALQQFITPLPNSHRSFSSNEFLTPDVVKPNGRGVCPRQLKIISNATVTRVLLKGKKKVKATGVEYILANNKEKVLKAHGKQIILCAGSINTPAILERSGYGDAARLKSLGIDVVVNNPNVGENLQNQYGPQGIITGSTTATPALQGFINGEPFLPNDQIRRLQFFGQNAPGG